MAAHWDFGVVTWSKLRVEKMGQLQMHEEGAVVGSLYTGKKTQLMSKCKEGC